MTDGLFYTGAVRGQGRVQSAQEEETVRLFDELRTPLLRYLVGFPLCVSDAEDVVQETFLSLFRSLQKGTRPENIGGWLFRVAHHLALKKRQRVRKDLENTAHLGNVEATLVDPELTPEDRVAFDQAQQRVRAVVRALPDQHRWCLYLRAEGLRYREIAEVVDLSLGSVSLYLERCVTLLSRAAQR